MVVLRRLLPDLKYEEDEEVPAIPDIAAITGAVVGNDQPFSKFSIITLFALSAFSIGLYLFFRRRY